MKKRVLFYVQHLLGIGHLKRAEILAHAMIDSGLDVTVAFGGRAVREVPFKGATVATLPAATIAGENFSALLDAKGKPIDEAWMAARRDALIALLRKTDPDVVLIELFPFGRRQFRFELLPLLDAVHAERRPPRVACSVRDILVAGKLPSRDAETVATLRRYFSAVLVHGDPALIRFEATFPEATRLGDLIRYTGYVASPSSETAAKGTGEVIVSAGGGAVGAPLLAAAMAARPLTALAGHVWRFLTGPNLGDDDFKTLAKHASERTIVERFRDDFADRLRASTLSISQAGYNTTMDILSAGARAIVVPYEAKGETEQRLRAEILARKGLLTLLPAAELSPARVVQAVKTAIEKPTAALSVDVAGAVKTARIVGELAALRGAGK
jgi:predicted glycosyltransferase